MHLCIKQSSIKNEDINALYKNLARYIKSLKCNLSIYRISKEQIDIRTYENGVGETLSCGSASLAVASLCIKDKCKVKSIRYRGWQYKAALAIFVVSFFYFLIKSCILYV